MKRASKVILAGIGTFLLALIAVSVNTPTPNQSSSNFQTTTSTSAPTESANPTIDEPATPKITTETETKTVSIPYDTTYRDDNTLTKGATRVVQEGSLGVREETYTITYTDGVETKRELTSSRITQQPIDRVIHNGTYVAPVPQQRYCENGTYINSAGQTVCRPSANNTGGATAICRDGSYSYSRSRRGTCSHHGGVRQWL